MNRSANHKGALFMVLAMAGFTINDALVKSVTEAMNAGQIIFVRGLMTSAVVVALAWFAGAFRPLEALRDRALVLRAVGEIAAAVTYVSALGLMPLANTAAILQALPLAVTLGAALYLGEPVGWRRWLAILAGFIGVLIVLRPGPDGFSLGAMCVVASVIFAATRDLCTRRIDAAIPALLITAVTSIAITVVGGLLVVPLGGWRPMDPAPLVRIAGASLALVAGYLGIVIAMRTGEISFIAPFRYTSLLWAIAIGMLFFGEEPDLWMGAGVAVIVASGLYSFYRENRRHRKTVGQETRPESP